MTTTPTVWKAKTFASDGVPPAGSGLGPDTFFENPKGFASLQGGGFVTFWQDGRSVQAEVYDALGNVQIAAFDIIPFWPVSIVLVLESNVSFATLNDGRLMVGVAGRTRANFGEEVYDLFAFNPDGSRFDFDPDPNVEQLQSTIPTTTTSNRDSLTIAPLNDGGFVVGYETTSSPVGLQNTLAMRRFDDNVTPQNIAAVPVDSLTLTDVSTTGDVRGPTASFLPAEDGTVVGLADGGFASAWRQNSLTSPATFEIQVRVFDENGAPRAVTHATVGGAASDEFNANTASLTNSGFAAPKLTALTGGNFVVSWFEFGANFFQADIHIAVYDGTGEIVRADVDLIEPSNEDPAEQAAKQDFTIIPLSGGGFVMGWREFRFTAPSTIDEYVAFQIFDETGAPVTAQIELAEKLAGSQGVFTFSGPSLLELDDGTILAVWGDSRVDGNYEAVRLSATGTQIGGVFSPFDTEQIPVSNTLNKPFLQLLDDGRVVASADEGSSTTFFTILDPRDDVITGDNAANVITSRLDGAKVNGLGGDDLLIGMGAADTLNGGTGHDMMNGGGGRDKLDGGAGRDTMNGGAGNDLFLVDDSGDKVIGGSGTDKVNASANFTLGNGVETLTLTGGKGLKGTGNDGDNTINGNAGKNAISGRNGNDVLKGGGGKDTIKGGNGNDVVKGGSGNDTLKGDGGKDLLFGDDGNDRIVGGGGSDTAVYKGSIGRYEVKKIKGGMIKVVDEKGSFGTDILSGIEKLKFGSTTFKVEVALKKAAPQRMRADDETTGILEDDTMFGDGTSGSQESTFADERGGGADAGMLFGVDYFRTGTSIFDIEDLF